MSETIGVKPLYRVDERPSRWWEALLFGWQHTLVDISPFVLPLAVASALGMGAAETAQLISFGLVAMGVATLVQTTIGNRLPIIQGPSATLVGTLAPIAAVAGAPVMWAGAFIGGLVEAVVGGARLVGWLRRFLPPLVSGVVVVAIGLSLGRLAVRLSIGDGSARSFTLAILAVATILLLQRYGRHVAGGLPARGAILLTIVLLGVGGGSALGAVDWTLVADKPWIQLPRLFPYGGPGSGWAFSLAAVAVVLVGYLGSMVESLGDYAATCAVAGERYEERHMNRGIFAEGVGSMISVALGGLPCTSYTQNIGIIATTRVASRFVVQIAGVILLLYGLCPKFGALLVAVPRSVLGGVFVVVCAMIVHAGVGLIRQAEPHAGDGWVVGVPLVLAVAVPSYVKGVLGEAWLAEVPAALALILTNEVVLAVLAGVGMNLVVATQRSTSFR